MIKKILLSVFLFSIGIICFLVYLEYSFNPLEKEDLNKVFIGYDDNVKKSCSKDFLGISSHGELYEIYLFKTKNIKINRGLSKIKEWERKRITDETIVKNWESCPLDSNSVKFFDFAFNANNLDDTQCFESFKKEVLNPDNYFSYFYFNELEQYFLLYCPSKQELYYIRHRGF